MQDGRQELNWRQSNLYKGNPMRFTENPLVQAILQYAILIHEDIAYLHTTNNILRLKIKDYTAKGN